MNIRDEAQIIKACQQHDLKAQQALYKAYVDRLYFVVYRYVKDQYYIENLLQDIFLKIFKYLDQFDAGKASFATWTKTIAVRTAINHCKKRITEFYPIEYASELPADEKITASLARLQAEDLLQIIAKIPEKYQIIFNLYEIDGYKHQEIAQLLDIKESTSRSYLVRAKKMIQEELTILHSYEILKNEKSSQ